MSFTLRWGIIATGGISTKFARDLLVDPSTRDSGGVAHKITAIGSRSTTSANAFLDKLRGLDGVNAWGSQNGVLDGAKGYGSYDEVYADSNVDAVYVGTPHTFHHAVAKAALNAGKHVLCEKPFTFDLAELDELISIAKEKNLFLMEAVWTRFHPIAYAVQDVLKSGRLGKVHRMFADFSMNYNPDIRDDKNRMIDPLQGGGSLLDQGPYPSVWAMLALHQHPDNQDKNPKVVNSYQRVYERSGVDAMSHWIVKWEGFAEARLLTDMTASGLSEATAVITCQEADLVIEYPPWRPESFTIVPHCAAAGEPGNITKKETHSHPIGPGSGMEYEADEVARCIRDGKQQSDRMPWDESRVTQTWLDDVRKAGNTVLKDKVGDAGK